jgi:hypothetical protein
MVEAFCSQNIYKIKIGFVVTLHLFSFPAPDAFHSPHTVDSFFKNLLLFQLGLNLSPATLEKHHHLQLLLRHYILRTDRMGCRFWFNTRGLITPLDAHDARAAKRTDSCVLVIGLIIIIIIIELIVGLNI